MTRKQKLYQRITNNQKNVKFNDFVTVIESFGFKHRRTEGSHHVYKHPDVMHEHLLLQPDRDGQAKPYQVR